MNTSARVINSDLNQTSPATRLSVEVTQFSARLQPAGLGDGCLQPPQGSGGARLALGARGGTDARLARTGAVAGGGKRGGGRTRGVRETWTGDTCSLPLHLQLLRQPVRSSRVLQFLISPGISRQLACTGERSVCPQGLGAALQNHTRVGAARSQSKWGCQKEGLDGLDALVLQKEAAAHGGSDNPPEGCCGVPRSLLFSAGLCLPVVVVGWA